MAEVGMLPSSPCHHAWPVNLWAWSIGSPEVLASLGSVRVCRAPGRARAWRLPWPRWVCCCCPQTNMPGLST